MAENTFIEEANENKSLPEMLQPKEEDIQELESEILEQNPGLSNIPEPQRKEIISRVLKISSSHHIGPIPSPDSLEKYNNIIPNGADRIMIQSEKQGDHRRKIETIAIIGQTAQSFIGQLFGLLIGIYAVYCSYKCIMNGHEISGAVFGATGITGLVSVFVLGKRRQKQSLKNKDEK